MKYDVDLEAFWREDELAHQNNCFASAGQVALGIRMSDECVFAELGEAGTPWMPIERARRIELNKRYNDIAEKTVGRRLLQEQFLPEDAHLPYVKRIGEIFGGKYEYIHDTEWLTQSVESPGELKVRLDRVDALDVRSFILPSNWREEKQRIYETYGIRPQSARHIRGPVTLACSIMGSENFLYLLIDEPELAERFSRAICKATLDIAAVMDEEAETPAQSHPGFSFADDNCCLLNAQLYETFAYPILKQIFARYSPNPGDSRYQHSDSAMGHLLPVLSRLDLTGVNFGPTVLISQIREHLPHARIDGCIAPMAFMRNDELQLERGVLRDIAAARQCGGVNLTTAGSINDGSLLMSMRQIMSIIQREGL